MLFERQKKSVFCEGDEEEEEWKVNINTKPIQIEICIDKTVTELSRIPFGFYEDEKKKTNTFSFETIVDL